jgi:lysophospholipase L1-like esterase
MKNLFFAIIAISISFILFVVSGETMLRLYDHIKGVTPPYTHNMPECIAIPNGYFNFDLQPGLKIIYDSYNPRKISVNRWGFRGAPDYDPIKPKDVTRIFCFGGSATFDPYVADDKTWANLVGEKLSKKLGKKIESVNAGRYGYTTSEILSLFYHRVLRHHPDVIVLYSTYNDAHTELSPYYSRDDGPQLYGSPVLSWLNKHSALFAYFDFRLRSIWRTQTWYAKVVPANIYVKPVPPEHNEFITDEGRKLAYLAETYRRNIRTILWIAKDNNVKVLLATQLIDPSHYSKAKKLITDTLRQIAKEENVPLLDFDKLNIDGTKEGLLYTYVHLSPKGTEFVSDKVSDALIESGLVK